MIKYALLGFVNTPDHPSNGSFLGSVDLDQQSGGYPWVRDDEVKMFTRRQDIAPVLESIKAAKLYEDQDNGSKYLTYDGNLFVQSYEKAMKTNKHEVFYVRMHLVKYDFTNPLNIQSTIMETVVVEGRTAHNYKTSSQAYYNTTSI